MSSLWPGLHDLLKDSRLKRKALTTLEGASFASINNTTTTLVTAGANVNGIIIRRALCIATTVGGSGSLNVGGNSLCAVSGADYKDSVENVRIPAGVALAATSSSAGMSVLVWYEVL